MKEMWKLEWKQWRNRFIVHTILPSVIIIIVFFLYKIKKDWLFSAVDMLFHLPDTVLAFMGLSAFLETGNISFFLNLAAIPIQLWFAWYACMLTFMMMQEEERTERILSICNQKYNRKELSVIKFRCINRMFFLPYLIWSMLLTLLKVIGSFNQEQRSSAFENSIKILFISAAVYVLLVAVCFMMAMIQKKGKDAKPFVNLIIFGILIVSNIYKVFDLVLEIAVYFQKESPILVDMGTKLQQLHNISPLYWLNPYAENEIAVIIVKICICICLGSICFILGRILYQRRSFIVFK